MTNYKVLCADCLSRYEQSGHKPIVCGVCGSDFIAVKAVNVADDMPLEDEDMHTGESVNRPTVLMYI